MEKCDVACGFPPHSQAETEEHISQKCVDLYPFCKEINLKLHVNNTRPNKKLDIKKLTYGAMTEVTHFAEKLCGTFEQICVDILNHNLDLDLQCGDSDLARSIVARIPAVLEKRKLLSYVKSHNNINSSTNVKLDSQNNPNSDAASAGSSQAAIIDQDVNSSPDIEHQNEFELKLWQLRENHIQQILSMPHEEHCPLYSYSRCKKVGIDFNVGSGVKQNLDPKLLTNGIMVELGTFATALLSAQKYFITEILEYNFHLDFHNELYRRTFAHKTIQQIRLNAKKKKSQMKIQFELPDTRCIPEPTFERHLYCPKCYQVRNHKHRQDESGSGHMHHPRPHTMTDAGSTDANCSARKPAKDPSSTFSEIEEMIMDNYPLCKEIGLSLCVDKDKPKDKLDTHVLTYSIMVELTNFAKRICGTNYKIISDVIQHNFNTGMQGQVVTTKLQFYRETKEKDVSLSWLNEVFVIQPLPIDKPRIVGIKKSPAVVHGSEWMDSIKKRKLALQTKVKTDKLPSVVKISEKRQNQEICYPICTEMGLDLEVTSKSGERKQKLDLEQLTRAVVFEIYKFVGTKRGCYFPHTVYEILDYNFDISSQHHRSWEFSITTASKFNNMVKSYRKYKNNPEKVFKLPFVFERRASQKISEKAQKRKCTTYPMEVPAKKKNKDHFVQQARYQSDENHVHFLDGAKIYEKTLFRNEDTKLPTDPGTSQVGAGCVGLLQGNLQIKEEEYDPCYRNMNPEPDMEKQYYPLHEVKTESKAEDAEHLVPGEPTERLRFTFLKSENENLQCLLAEPQGCAVSPNTARTVITEWDREGVTYLVPVEAAGCLGSSMVTTGQGNKCTSIKEEQENVPVDSHSSGVHKNEVGI
ncbi:uncharacterized protein LOC117727398 [Cyclopterus lumpus]|uniref:uncharacterized protein LOC117727398 n=1 Tax=Cyclopterus lumpus TaxID=8103 RepID=UPI0014866E91|nr:uncharacterized protein LOC117727398 [Cyclopterus lumpus]